MTFTLLSKGRPEGQLSVVFFRRERDCKISQEFYACVWFFNDESFDDILMMTIGLIPLRKRLAFF